MKPLSPCRWAYCCLLLGLTACGPTPPDEITLRMRLKGIYCDDAYQYRLELNDSTYFNRRVFKSPLGAGHSYESCRGRYSLAFEEEKRWVIRFEKDPRPNAVDNCNSELVVWDHERGYLLGDEEQVVMPDCFDGQLLVQRGCQ